MHYVEHKNPHKILFYETWADGVDREDFRNVKNLVIGMFNSPLTNYIKQSNHLIEKLVSTLYISIKMPAYVSDINYFQTGKIRKLEPFLNPEIPVDTLGLTRREIAKLKKSKSGEYYKKNASFFQHKPYNYYVAILKAYFPMDYKELDLLYLPEKSE